MSAMRKQVHTVPKVGMKTNLGMNLKDRLAKALNNRFKRRSILTVPDEIAAAHTDKHFVYVPYTDFELNGGYHPSGYELFVTDQDSGTVKKNTMNFSKDGLVHRREMVLAWLPKEEQEERELETMILRNSKNFEKFFEKDAAMKGFSPSVKETRDSVTEKTLLEEFEAEASM